MLVLYRADRPLAKHEIIGRTLLADLTTRYALNRLEEAELIQARPPQVIPANHPCSVKERNQQTPAF